MLDRHLQLFHIKFHLFWILIWRESFLNKGCTTSSTRHFYHHSFKRSKSWPHSIQMTNLRKYQPVSINMYVSQNQSLSLKFCMRTWDWTNSGRAYVSPCWMLRSDMVVNFWHIFANSNNIIRRGRFVRKRSRAILNLIFLIFSSRTM